MTEAEWLRHHDAQEMLRFLEGKPSQRKWRLLICAFLRSKPRDRHFLRAFTVAEAYADGTISAKQFKSRMPKPGVVYPGGLLAPAGLTLLLTHIDPLDSSWAVFAAEHAGNPEEILRHIVGNPFRLDPAPATWTSTIVDLAQSIYAGNDNRAILADALEESGHAGLAEHFRKQEWHPKGCWVVDMILGKQ